MILDVHAVLCMTELDFLKKNKKIKIAPKMWKMDQKLGFLKYI